MQFTDRCVPWKIANGAENLAGATVLTGGYLPQIPKQDKQKSLRI
jgi:hypothetical protein